MSQPASTCVEIKRLHVFTISTLAECGKLALTSGGFVPARSSWSTPFSTFRTLCTTPSSEKDEIADVPPETWRRHCSLEATMVDGTWFLGESLASAKWCCVWRQ